MVAFVPFLLRGALWAAPKIGHAFTSAARGAAIFAGRNPTTAVVGASVATDLANGEAAGSTLGRWLPAAAETVGDFAGTVVRTATGSDTGGQDNGQNGNSFSIRNLFNPAAGGLLEGMNGPGAIIGGLLGFMNGNGFLSSMFMMVVGAMIGKFVEDSITGANAPAPTPPALGGP